MDVRPACEACATDECAQARVSCLEDDACTAILRCKGKCSHPACLQECDSEHGFSPWYDDYFSCVLGESGAGGACVEPCLAGQNWGCLGNYEWPSAGSASFDVRFRFVGPRLVQQREEPFFVGAEARSCNPGFRDSDVVDATNSVDLQLRGDRHYLEVESPDVQQFGVRERFYWLPHSVATEVRIAHLERRLVDFFAGGWHNRADDRLAQIAAYVVDCTGVTAPSVSVEFPGVPAAQVWHMQGAALGPQFDATTAGVAFAPDIPEEAVDAQIVVRATLPDAQAVAERSIWARVGWITHVLLYPRTRSGR
jgi:hypothetical protein